jgi:hypothetical protein
MLQAFQVIIVIRYARLRGKYITITQFLIYPLSRCSASNLTFKLIAQDLHVAPKRSPIQKQNLIHTPNAANFHSVDRLALYPVFIGKIVVYICSFQTIDWYLTILEEDLYDREISQAQTGVRQTIQCRNTICCLTQ